MKKLWSLLLALALVLGGTSAFALNENAGVLPIVENPGDVTITIAVTDHPAIEDWNTNEFTLWLEEVTNLNLEFVLIPLEGRAEKLSLILASGDYPDMFMSVGMTDALISRYGVEEGMFLPLQDLIDEWGVNTQQVFEDFQGTEGRMTQLDGNIYSLPVVNECYHCLVSNKFFINQKWLDNLGLDTPTNMDEFYDVLVAFRDEDANGNGDPNDEIPLSGTYDDGWETLPERFIMNAFTYYSLDLKKTTTTQAAAFGLYVEDGTITVPFYKTDEMKAGLNYIAKLSNEGLLYPGTFTQNLNQLTQLAENDTLGASAGGYILFAELGGENYRNFSHVLPLTGPDGYQNVVGYPYDSVAGHYIFIAEDSEHAEECIRLADLMYTFESSMRSYYGVKGVDWDEPEEGAVGINGEPALYKIITPWQEAEPQNQHVVQMSLSRRDSAFRMGEPSDPNVDLYSAEGLETYLYQITAEYLPYTESYEKALPPLKFTDAENDAMSVMKAELNTAIKEGMTAFMTGARDVDTEFDAFVADLESKGLSDLIGFYQAAYDAQYK